LTKQEENWIIAAAQAAATAKAMGIGAGDAARAIAEQVAPKVDWREVLRRYLSTAAKSDYAWTPPNRRYIARGIYLPSLRSETLGPVVIAVDTSGSIDDATLAAFAAEIAAILEDAAPEAVHVVYCDDAVAATEDFEPGDLVRLTPHGGGGTAFRPVFDWVAKSDIRPVCAVYLTDLCGDDFGPEPDYPVLWVSTAGTEAPFGEVIPHR
jgi:predicted metal-dependent peptidase